ncbi:MAG: enoyl-CoA hydratase/isomerase family protein [Eubacteriales bacterium]|nr:enoyl-CoA hydratase/isomerase family protein [Eubacteriales bacterium]
MATLIQYEKKELVGYITIIEENERHPCTLDWDSLAMLENAISEIEKDRELRAVVLQSASPKSFIVGANINVLKTLNADNIQDWVKNGHRIFRRLQALPVPVIAKVEKYALGGGLELAMSCDMILASEEARFAQPEAGLGVMPGWGGSYRLANLIGLNRAKEMFFTGEQISAAQAYEWGLVNHVYPADQLDEGVNTILEGILKNDGKVLQMTKEIVNTHNLRELTQSAYEEAATSAVVMSSESTLGRLKAFFDSRKKK